MISTLVKTLNGDLFTVDHRPGALEHAINLARPEMYTECQVLTYPDPEDKRFVCVVVDDVNNAISIDLEKDHRVFIHTHPKFLENYDNDCFLTYIDEYLPYRSKYTIECSSINFYWKSIYHPKTRYGYTLSIIFHPEKGLTCHDMMQDEYVDRFNEDAENEEEKFENWMVPKKDEKNIWFPTFREFLLHFCTMNPSSKLPRIFRSEDFLNKVEMAFLDLKTRL